MEWIIIFMAFLVVNAILDWVIIKNQNKIIELLKQKCEVLSEIIKLKK
jgi:hypothetical protein